MQIVENQAALLADFIRLNEEWIKTYFDIEEADRELAKDPGKVIDEGGYIFSLIENDQVEGVCALFNKQEGVFELARMAVRPQSQGKGYGKILMETALAKLGQLHAKRVYLVSNTKLKAAIALYKQYGFTILSEGSHPGYSRANIVMGRELNKG